MVISEAKVQSEADANEDNTIPTGSYEGYVLDYSGSYDDPILLVNEDLGVTAGQGNLIHPDQYTNPDKVQEMKQAGESYGPWNQPYSQGCQITSGKNPYDELIEEMKKMGYEPRGTYDVEGNIYGDPDTIQVNIKNK